MSRSMESPLAVGSGLDKVITDGIDTECMTWDEEVTGGPLIFLFFTWLPVMLMNKGRGCDIRVLASGGDGGGEVVGGRGEMTGGGWGDVDVEGEGRRGCPITAASWFIDFERHFLLSATDTSNSAITLTKSSLDLPLENMVVTQRLLILDLLSLI